MLVCSALYSMLASKPLFQYILFPFYSTSASWIQHIVNWLCCDKFVDNGRWSNMHLYFSIWPRQDKFQPLNSREAELQAVNTDIFIVSYPNMIRIYCHWLYWAMGLEWMDVSELLILQRLVSLAVLLHCSLDLPGLTFSGFLLIFHCFELSRVWLHLIFTYSFTCGNKQFETTSCRILVNASVTANLSCSSATLKVNDQTDFFFF